MNLLCKLGLHKYKKQNKDWAVCKCGRCKWIGEGSGALKA
jgi:hypothetical protein